jgi:hypothetical protein
VLMRIVHGILILTKIRSPTNIWMMIVDSDIDVLTLGTDVWVSFPPVSKENSRNKA